ncbi:unnamed protein product [Thlaspi arvense]|uniref:Cytochrome P450 n=1 Tax=Thlaspi arvense TaxID=13288 RepID=A0AAU9SF93_THLAR|nr:unnamed protein product [Thlaspi arvense]
MIMNIYIAGVDANAITMIWAMAELVRNPSVMKKVQDETRTWIGINSKERIVEEDLDMLQYLKLVVKETEEILSIGKIHKSFITETKKDKALRCCLLVLVGGFVQVLLLGLRPLNWDSLICFTTSIGDCLRSEDKKNLDMEEAGDVTIIKKVLLQLVPVLRC